MPHARLNRLAPLFMALLPLSCALHGGTLNLPRSTDPTGCAVEAVTNAAFDHYQVFGVSRDGTWLSAAWSRGEDQAGRPVRGVFNLNLVTGERVDLPEPVNNSGAFSPDGEYLVVAHYDASGKTDILELYLATGTTRVIAAHEHWDWLPSYSADGRHIVFNSQRDGQSDIYLYERASGRLQRLTTYPGYDAHAQFSPDDRRVLFHRMNGKRDDGGYDFDLIVHDLASGEEKRITDGPFEESYAAFAPDGRHVVFSSDVGNAPEKHNLYVLDTQTSERVQLTDGDWKDSYAYWTADGEYIYFNSDRHGVTNVLRLPMRGHDCVRQ